MGIEKARINEDSGNSKKKNHLKDEAEYDQKKILRNSCLLCGIIIVICGCIFLFAYMDEDEWSEKSYVRERVLLIAVLLFISATGLCLYIMRTDKNEQITELSLLIIDNPPSYESIFFQEPPPAYITVVRSIHIVQQETTG